MKRYRRDHSDVDETTFPMAIQRKLAREKRRARAKHLRAPIRWRYQDDWDGEH